MKGQCPPHSLAHADAHTRRGWPPQLRARRPSHTGKGGAQRTSRLGRDAGWGTGPAPTGCAEAGAPGRGPATRRRESGRTEPALCTFALRPRGHTSETRAERRTCGSVKTWRQSRPATARAGPAGVSDGKRRLPRTPRRAEDAGGAGPRAAGHAVPSPRLSEYTAFPSQLAHSWRTLLRQLPLLSTGLDACAPQEVPPAQPAPAWRHAHLPAALPVPPRGAPRPRTGSAPSSLSPLHPPANLPPTWKPSKSPLCL